MVFSVFVKQLLYCRRVRIPLSFVTKRLNSTNRMWLDRPSFSEVGVRVMSPDEKNRSDHGKSWTLLITILFLSNAGDISLKDIYISTLSAGAISYAKQIAAFWNKFAADCSVKNSVNGELQTVQRKDLLALYISISKLDKPYLKGSSPFVTGQ